MSRIQRAKRSFLTLGLIAIGLTACAQAPSDSTAIPGQATSTDSAELAKTRAIEVQERKHLEVFDDLDFNVYSGQKWDEFHRSHAANILVHYPDGPPPPAWTHILPN